jgi:hypothetical protein
VQGKLVMKERGNREEERKIEMWKEGKGGKEKGGMRRTEDGGER